MKNKPIQLAKVVKRDYNHETRGLNHVKIKPSEQNVKSQQANAYFDTKLGKMFVELS
ncbi:MAG: hypothetical protein II609_01705 [Muribaculaceae bacterium]|nr:hypothetical protein [Muribaculaceae bacterium]